MKPTEYLEQLDNHYLSLHHAKENAFWHNYMDLSGEKQDLANADTELSEYLSDPSNIATTRNYLEQAKNIQDPQERKLTSQALQGWLTMFEAYAIESEAGRKLRAEIIAFTSEIFEKKKHHTLFYTDENGEQIEASLPVLASNIHTSDSEVVRQSSHQALLDLEQWVLANGYLDLVKMRNKFARELGFKNYFEYTVNKIEHISTQTLFSMLDSFEQATRDTNFASQKHLSEQKGPQVLKGYNFVYAFSGDSQRKLDQYVPFSKSLRRWVESFGRLNIEFCDAELTLDLLDRKGKFPNGFCHGPNPGYYKGDEWIAAKVNFTSNAKPDQVGSGYDGINTLFHEGGHAAHFSNMRMNSPCFSHEFAPMSMAYAETQSMFCDSLLGDADWLKRYAFNDQGEVVPDALLKEIIDSKQPFKAYTERSLMVVSYFESALYEMDESQLTADNVTRLARQVEKKILGLECSHRPVIAVPHILGDDSACCYHGYLLANMAVYQTRAFFTNKYGYLTDNPNIGPELAKHYWLKGNSQSHHESIMSLTNQEFSSQFLADACNLSPEAAWAAEEQKIIQSSSRPQTPPSPLNATIKIIDGDTLLANNAKSDQEMFEQFEQYIEKTY
ncbi:M3 family metallopeptidase [Vibrio sp. SCSIO 43136]|uniref:M3 family metallopeptidase n=1 Tax=Vibrio sp. SCSIO 43136 TaxID=2819101 RepID=UPI00207532AA|nr:M3 family metallopeptidase [Vibrio sp. SCSIO 43136]USD66819.1 M3 family oligoendopeptidase [Vibrio sp. SCSIO 43136]